MRRVDRRTNALPTVRQTDRPTDTASYRGALSHLKMFSLLNSRERNNGLDFVLRGENDGEIDRFPLEADRWSRWAVQYAVRERLRNDARGQRLGLSTRNA